MRFKETDREKKRFVCRRQRPQLADGVSGELDVGIGFVRHVAAILPRRAAPFFVRAFGRKVARFFGDPSSRFGIP